MSAGRVLAALVPGLLAGGAMYARSQGMFGGPETSNDKQWANMGKGLNADGSANTNAGFPAAPMQLTGALLGGGGNNVGDMSMRAPPRPFNPSMSPNFPLSQMPMQMPNGLAGPAFGGMLPSQMMAQMHPVMPMQAQQPPQQQAPAFNPPIAGGSATPQTNPFLYAQLYAPQIR